MVGGLFCLVFLCFGVFLKIIFWGVLGAGFFGVWFFVCLGFCLFVVFLLFLNVLKLL